MPKDSFHINDVHIWMAPLNIATQIYQVLSGTLSIDECKRVKEFVFNKDRQRFVVARGMLRNILAKYLGFRSEDISFEYAAHWKSNFRSPENTIALQFNLSHSRDSLAIADPLGKEVRIDIEDWFIQLLDT